MKYPIVLKRNVTEPDEFFVILKRLHIKLPTKNHIRNGLVLMCDDTNDELIITKVVRRDNTCGDCEWSSDFTTPCIGSTLFIGSNGETETCVGYDYKQVHNKFAIVPITKDQIELIKIIVAYS